MLEDDKQRPRKQRHTAKRIFERLRAEHSYTGGYTIVKDYVRAAKLGGRNRRTPLRHRFPLRHRHRLGRRSQHPFRRRCLYRPEMEHGHRIPDRCRRPAGVCHSDKRHLASLPRRGGHGRRDRSLRGLRRGSKLAGPNLAGRWIGLQNCVANIAGVTGPAPTGLLVDRTGSLNAAFTLAAAVAVFGALSWILGIRRSPAMEPVPAAAGS